VRVRDSGAGIPADRRDRIFEPFFTTKPEGRGTGLGLFLSRDVVEGLDGHLVLESGEPGDCCFRVELQASAIGSAPAEVAS